MAAADAESSHDRRPYVKLWKEESDGDAPAAGAEDILPGELNQAVQLKVRKCDFCWQELPPGYEFPADEPWSTTIFGCADDPESCWTRLVCLYVLFGRNTEAVSGVPWVGPCTCHALCVGCGITMAVLMVEGASNGVIGPHLLTLIGEGLLSCWMLFSGCLSSPRYDLQKKYHLKNTPCNSWPVHATLHWCAICQEHREMKGRLDAKSAAQATIVSPPPLQEMSKAEIRSPTPAPENEAAKTGHDNVWVVVTPL